MASTYSVQDALNIANRSISRPVEADHASYIANIALSKVWHAYDWRGTIEDLPPFYLIPLIQTYGAPYYAVPNDFYGLRTAYLVQTLSTPLPNRSEIKCLKNIRKEFIRGLPRDIGYVPEDQAFRIFPVCPESVGSTQFLIDGTYKKLAPKTTSTTLQSTPVPWDDIYIEYFVDALRWAGAKAADSPAEAEKLQKLYECLSHMADQEGLELGDQAIAPSEPLVGGVGYGYWPGVGPGFF